MDPTRRYVIASSPRTGSYLLCEGLAATGVAGRPTEPFCAEFRGDFCRRWRLPPSAGFADYFRAVEREGSTSNGVFGVKIHWPQIAGLARASGVDPRSPPRVLDHLFPGARFIHLVRRDRRAQAISMFRAAKTNEWWRITGVHNDQITAACPAFDSRAIRRLEDDLERQEESWSRYFRARGLEPLTIEYEQLARRYREEIARALAFLGLDEERAAAIPSPRLERQADATTREWRRRLDAEDAGRAAPLPSTFEAAPPAAPALAAILENRTWLRRERPFLHVTARRVFTPDTYRSLERAFEVLLAEGLHETPRPGRLSRSIAGYDAYGMGIDETTGGPFSLFVSPEWHGLLARLFDVEATPYVNAGLHHHLPRSESGSIHNDFNPVWFVRAGAAAIQCPKHDVCSYKTGAGPLPDAAKVQVVRAVAMIFYLANGPWTDGDGGETGLFQSARQPLQEPAVRVPPEDNSVVAFECTPRSYHAFLRNTRRERNSVILWLHRTKADALSRWPERDLERWRE